MPKLTIVTDDGEKTAEVPADKRLVLAIEEQGVNIGHRCGGQARCTTCRVEFLDGEPDTMTKGEHAVLETRGLAGQARLSCQILTDHDMRVKALMTAENQTWPDTGPTPDATIMPDPERLSKAELDAGSA